MLAPRSLLLTAVMCCTLQIFSVRAATTANEELFQKGLAAYQNKQYAEARDDFQKVLDQDGTSPSVLHNMALSAYQADQKPLALALWRKALTVAPGFSPAKAGRDFLEGKMQMRPLERDSLNLWAHRELESFSFYHLLWLNALVLALAGFLGLRYFGERGAALEEERPLPDFPTVPLLAALALLASLSLVALKAKDAFTPRATITAAKASVRSLPSEDGVQLFDISGGSEVLVRREQSGWTQVQNGDGASGWVKNSDVFLTSER